MSVYNSIEPYNPDKAWLYCQLSSSDGTSREKIKWGDSLKYGKPGDQTGLENNSRRWTPGWSSGGFGNVYRFHNRALRRRIAKAELQVAANGNIGYSQIVNKSAWHWRGAFMRAMCAKQQGLNMQAWGEARFPQNWSYTHSNTKLNMHEIDLKNLNPTMADVPCNADCSSSALSSVQISTGLWFHTKYAYNGVYNRFMTTVPNAVYGMSGGGHQQAKFFRKCLVAAEETELDWNSLGYNFNDAKCDWIDYTDYDVAEIYDLTDAQKDPSFVWGTSSTVYNDSLHPSDTYDSTLTNWAPPTYGGRNVRVWHVGFNPANTDRNINYRYRTQSHWQSGSPNVGLKDKNGNYIRWNLYVYGYGPEAPTKTWVGEGTEPTDPSLRRRDGNYKWQYAPTMSHFVAADDGEHLLEAIYSNGDFVAYEDENGNRPWQSYIKCKQWSRNNGSDIYTLGSTQTLVTDQPYTYRYYNYEDVEYALQNDLPTVEPEIATLKGKMSCLRYYAANNMSGIWTSRSTWPDQDLNWRTNILSKDAGLDYVQAEGWTDTPMPAGWTGNWWGDFDINGGGTGVRNNWINRNKDTKIFNKKVERKMRYYSTGNYTATTFPEGSTRPSDESLIFFANVGTSAEPIWVYWASGGKTSDLRGSVCWVKTSTTINPTDDLFPYFSVTPCNITSVSTRTFEYNGNTYTIPAANTNCYYRIWMYSSGEWYYQWHRTKDNQVFHYIETTLKTETHESEQFPSEGSEDNPEYEYTIWYIRRNNNGVWEDTEPPFGAGYTEDEDEQQEVEIINGDVMPVILYDTMLWSSDWI